MKIRLKIISLVMASLVGIAFCFAGCGNTESTLEELKQSIQNLQGQIAEQTEALEKLKGENTTLSGKLDELKETNKQLQEQLEDAQYKINAPYGNYYSLETAYKYKYLTRENLLEIAYIQNGGREYNEEIMPEDYAPESPELTKDTERKITESEAFYYLHEGDTTYSKVEYATIYKYHGRYENGSTAAYVALISPRGGVDDANWLIDIDGIKFLYNDGNRITVLVTKL